MDEQPHAETLGETVLHVRISSEAPYAKTIVMDMLEELASTLDFTEMYSGEVVVETPQGKVIKQWSLGSDWKEHDGTA